MSYADPDAYFVIDRATIRMPYVSDRRAKTIKTWPIITVKSPKWARLVVEQIARQYARETPFGVPYSVYEDEEVADVVLLPTESSFRVGRASLIGGAVAINAYRPKPWITWAWVHPYLRGRHLVDHALWNILRVYPNLTLWRDPFNTSAGNKMLDRLEASDTYQRHLAAMNDPQNAERDAE